MVELRGHNAINVFHDVNSILHTVTDIYPKAEILLKCYQCFSLWKLAFIHINQHLQHAKKHKNGNSHEKVTEDSRVSKT